MTALVTQAGDEAREELDEEEFDELNFSDALEAEFYEAPSDFVGRVSIRNPARP